ncbi:TetR/AcrR family transcriptional regulator [Nonomuraea zeae]|uniref:TetR/AcrR family transcriptional regulator n=1 Tax=Nonomuraea zeae TaxID=1642303 RepID=A0A5S4GVB9_9ACTN|nr:TetR/AcrR family transcriptional regulator [Nonomuraea zeae]TMR36451.1 TetR/AcrR family transcriptional regulator [Nonomuraea zeae]
MNDGASPGKRRAGRPAVLTIDRIVTAAVEILDDEGLEALTMRRLGTRLGVAAVSLYRHVPNREALTAVQSVGVFVLGHALAQVGTPPGGTAAEPDEAARDFYDQWFDAGLRAMVTGFERQLAGRD